MFTMENDLRTTRATSEMLVIPYRTDFLFLFMSKLSRQKPVHTGLLYFTVSFAFIYLIGLVTGQFAGKGGLPPMYTTVLDNINLGLIAPVGAGLLCHLYNTIRNSFTLLLKENTIASKDHQSFRTFLKSIEKLYNSKLAIVTAFSVSLVINVFNHVTKTDSWLGVNGGITGLYARIFITINFFIIGYIVYKCIVTVYAMRKIFTFEINVHPLHPDQSGGLMPIGRLAISVNYFIGLIILFFTLLFTLDPFAANNYAYLTIIVCFYLLSPFLLLSSLSKANKVMSDKKRETLEKLSRTFNHYFKQLNHPHRGDIFDITSADEIIRVNKLYGIVERMPVWPFDVKSLARLVSTLSIPLVPFIFEYVISQITD